MSHRYVAATLFAGSLLLIIAGYLLYEHPDLLGLCVPHERCLSESVFYGVADPLYHRLWPLPPLFLFLGFVRREVFLSWAKFFLAVCIVPMLLVIAAPPMSHGFFGGFPDRPRMTEIMVRFATLSSLAFVAVKYVRIAQKRNGVP